MDEEYTPKHSDVLYYYTSTQDTNDLDITHNSCVYYPGRDPKWTNIDKRMILITGGAQTRNIELISWLRTIGIPQVNYLYNDRGTQSNNLTTYICSKLSVQPAAIESIVFSRSYPNNYDQVFSVGASDPQGRILNEDSELRCYCTFSSSTNKYSIIISNNSNIIPAPQKINNMFRGCTSISGLNVSILDTSITNSMESVCENCSSMSFFTHNFNTSLVTSFKKMFAGCENISTLDLRSFNTSNTTNMSYMFYNCRLLNTLNISNAHTSGVTDMSYMFYHCEHLPGYILGYLEFNSVITTSHMCDGSGVDSVNMNWNTTNLQDMSYMFANCTNLYSFSVPISSSSTTTASVTNMASLFEGCVRLQTLSLSKFNTANVQNFSRMFYGCTKLNRLYLTNFVIDAQSDVVDMLTLGSNLDRGLTQITLPAAINKNFTVSAGNMKWRDPSDNLITDGIINSSHNGQIITGKYEQILVSHFASYMRLQLNTSNIVGLYFVDSVQDSDYYDEEIPVGVSSVVNASTPDIDSELRAYCKYLGSYQGEYDR